MTVQSSSDLIDWSGEGIETRVLSQDSVTRTVEARIPVGDRAKIFLRGLFELQD